MCNLSALHDKATSMHAIRDLTHSRSDEVVIIGVGDSDNDLSMLEAADVACVIPRNNQPPLMVEKNKTCKGVIYASQVAPLGWQEAVEGAIAFLKTEYRGHNG